MAELLDYFDSPAKRVHDALKSGCSGSSPQSAIWAAERGLPYAFADFINPDGAPFAASYRDHFQALGRRLAQPKIAVCVWAVCADTQDGSPAALAERAHDDALAVSRQLIPVPPVEKAEEFLAEGRRAPQSLPLRRRIVAGDPGNRFAPRWNPSRRSMARKKSSS